MNTFYTDPAVRQRLVEYLGGDTLDHATAVYLTRSDGCRHDQSEQRPASDLDWFLERDCDIARSLADTASVLMHLDVEYVNFDSPAEAYVDPWRTFDLQEPVVRVIEEKLLQWGIRPLHMITGQGHHFVWRIKRRSELAHSLATLCPAPELLGACVKRVPARFAAIIDDEAQRIFSGVALVMEYVAHRVKETAQLLSALPVEITAVCVGPGTFSRREIISIDTSEYGDPLHTRMVRMPFTNYLKPWVTGLAQSLGADAGIPRFRAIPLHEIDVQQAIKVRQVESEVLDLARRACVRIPEQSDGTTRLLDDYLVSSLRRFHQHYYSSQHDPKDRWPHTYDRTPLETLPPCAREVIEHPNDRLLKPAGMQFVTRSLLAQGWHPRHIAGFIRSKFENPAFHWGVDWSYYEPATRADFYTRLFAGLIATGLDGLVDLNCTSAREKGLCVPQSPGGCSLEPTRHALLSRHSPAASWPIGISTGCFYRRSIFSVLEEIHASGFREIEICSFPKHLDYHNEADVRRAGEMIRALGIRPYSFHAPFADRIDITSLDRSVREAAVNELITACRAAALIGAENVVLHPGPEREGRPPEAEFIQHINHAAESLNIVAARCHDMGVRLLLENMLPHLLFGHTSDMLYLLGRISSAGVGACLDTGHARLSGDLPNVVQKLSGHLKMVHINDNLGDRDDHLIPGDGSIDWQWFIDALLRHQFSGGLIIEMAAGESESVADTLVRARRGHDYLTRLLPKTTARQ
jgi:sugar phosphate isomerase/epimerase